MARQSSAKAPTAVRIRSEPRKEVSLISFFIKIFVILCPLQWIDRDLQKLLHRKNAAFRQASRPGTNRYHRLGGGW